MSKEFWANAHRELQGRLSEEEDRILSLLAKGKNQPEIGTTLGLHRSAVWRRIQKLKKKVGSPTPIT